MAPDGVVFGVLLGRICMAQVAHKYMDGIEAARPDSIRATETTAEKLSSFFPSASFLASQGWIFRWPPPAGCWVPRLGPSLLLSHALFLLRLCWTGPEKTDPPVMSRSWSWARRGMWECEVALPSLGFESCMASAFRTQRESLLDWRAEAEPWTLSPIAWPAAPDPEA